MQFTGTFNTVARRLAVACVSVFCLNACAGSKALSTDAADLTWSAQTYPQKVQALLDAAAEDGFRGTVYIRQRSEDVLSKGYGMADDKAGIRNGIHVVYDFGSLTKQFTAAAILQLAEQGKLALTDTLDKYFDNVPQDKAGITLHQLLTHSAGLDPYTGNDYTWVAPQAFVDAVMSRELVHTPGEQYDYANLGYSLLGMIIEKVSGEAYESYINQTLFKPLGLSHTGYLIPDWQSVPVAQGYGVGDFSPWGSALTRWQGTPGVSWNLQANGGMLSTPLEMMNWVSALDHGKVISEQSLAAQNTPQVLVKEGIGYGYGWRQRIVDGQTKLVFHGGSNGVFLSVILRFADEQQTTVVFVSNEQHDGVIGLIRQMMRMGLDANYQPEPYEKPSLLQRLF